MIDSLLNAAICYSLGILLVCFNCLFYTLVDLVLQKYTRYQLTDVLGTLLQWSVAGPAFITGTLILVQAFLI